MFRLELRHLLLPPGHLLPGLPQQPLQLPDGRRQLLGPAVALPAVLLVQLRQLSLSRQLGAEILLQFSLGFPGRAKVNMMELFEWSGRSGQKKSLALHGGRKQFMNEQKVAMVYLHPSH